MCFSGQWVEDSTAEFASARDSFGYTVVGGTTLVAAGGSTGVYQNEVVLLEPNSVQRTLSATLPVGVIFPCTIGIDSTS